MAELKQGSVEHDMYHFIDPANFSWQRCDCKAGDFDDTPKAEIVEALMMIAKNTVDEAGLLVLFNLPPAVAVAIIKAMESGDPKGFVRANGVLKWK